MKDVLKKILSNGILTVLIIPVFYIIYLRECKRPDPCPPQGMILIEQSKWDSLLNIKPEVVRIRDTIYKDTTIYVDKPIPTPVIVSPDLREYKDSLVNDSIDVTSTILVEGFIKKWSWEYSPIIHEREIIIEVPIFHELEIPVYLERRSLYGSVVVGGDMDIFVCGADLDYINRRNNLYGLQYRRFDDKGIIGFKIGIRIF